MTFVKNAAAGAVLGGSLLFSVGLGAAHAQPAEPAQPAQAADGLVNLAIGEVTLAEGVTVDRAAAAAAAICAAVPADVLTTATQVDGDGVQQTVCSGLPGGDLVVAQNVAAPAAPAESPAPQAPAEESPAPEAPAEEPATEGESGTGEGLGAPEGTGAGEDGDSPLPSENEG
ncbi:hypothetical protein [Mycobacterium sp. NAZ190054]|uniref:hypothetical protein n=1 Tax=Mycobacterium sp. NAZ190054 TaxID=1747766 RepID=UPI00079C9E33|nr:hypothetical protein [Mycobacterium sp. NAZ190054]KWX66042.1 hypothetical protein ASJ79_26920 [Mycobacterium sp. NAZ190054]